jgi:DNA-binding CsgD family transcriptional regulator
MAGKSAWETGRILSVSENTVNFHVKNCVRKLAATNKREAVVKGMALGIL